MRARVWKWAAAVALGILPMAAAESFGQGAALKKTGAIQAAPNGQTVWCVNPDHDSITKLIDGGTFYNSIQFHLPNIGRKHNPRGLAISPDSTRVWVAAQDSDRVFVYDAVFDQLLFTIDLPAGSSPTSVIFSPDGSKVIVALYHARSLAVFDAATRAQIATVPNMFRRPQAMTFTTNPNELWVTHALPEGENSYISVVDTTTWTVKSFIEFKLVNPRNSGQVQDDPVPIAEGGYILFRGQVAQPPGSNDLWTPCQYHNFLNDQMTADSSVQAAIHKVNLTTHEHYVDNRTVLTAVYAHTNSSVLVGDGWNARIAGPIDIAFDAAGTTAYIANNSSNDVVVVPTNIGLAKPAGAPPLTEIPVGEAPIGITASPIYNKLYVLNYLSRSISIINTTTNTVTGTFSTTPFTVDPVPADVRLGAMLFTRSDDPRISSSGKVSCASCHPDGDTDGFPWEFGQFGAGSRVTLSLLGQYLTVGPQVKGRGQFHRGGDRDELQDFDATYRLPFMNGTGFFPAANPALGAPNAGLNADVDALAAFILSLPAVQNSPSRAPDGSLTESQVRGAALFKSSSGPYATHCNDCHTAPTFSDQNFHDVGGLAPAPEFNGPTFNTPSLVGVWDRPPYKQVAGAVATDPFFTLSDVLRATNARTGAHGNTAGLTQTQMHDLESFLRVIDGKMTIDGIDAVVDVTPPRITEVRPLSLDAVQVVFNETVDPVTAGDPANYMLSNGLRGYFPTAAVVDTARGNIVTLSVPLGYDGCDVTYSLSAVGIEDVAGLVSGGADNVLDTTDITNARSFTLNGSITVTFGDSGDETFSAVAKDASFNSALSSTSHWNIRLYPQTTIPTKGFVAFDFIPTLQSMCGVASGADILDARFSLMPKIGYANTIEFRRCFQPWNEAPIDLCVGCSGVLTRQHSTYNTILWKQSGARSLGGSGTTVEEYYPSNTRDTAATADASIPISSMTARQEFASPGITDAFRFWYDNPATNFGYAVNAIAPTSQGTEFWAHELEGGRYGPALSITFAIHPRPTADCDGDGTADDCQLLADGSLDMNANGVLDACEPGACCVAGECQQLTSAACASLKGEFQGIGVDCEGVMCPLPPPPKGGC